MKWFKPADNKPWRRGEEHPKDAPQPQITPEEEINHAPVDRGEALLDSTPPRATQAPPMPVRSSRIVSDGGAVHGGMLGDDEDAPIGPVDPSGRPMFTIPKETFEADELEDTGEEKILDGLSRGVNPPAPGEKVYQ